MKSIKINKKLFLILFLNLAVVFLLQGCGGGGHGRAGSYQKEKMRVYSGGKRVDNKPLTAVDKKIINTKRQIAEYEEFATKRLHEAVINDVKNHDDRGAVKLDGKPTYEDLATRGYADVAATEKVIQRLENKLEKLESEKQIEVQQSPGCFLPETMVKMEDGSLQPFSKLQPGQKVLTYDIGYDKLINKKVMKLYSVQGNHLYTINKQLMTTGGERLLGQNGWVKISNLKKGDFVHLSGNMVKIESIDYVRTDQKLYNIQVDDTHNFYVVTPDGSNYLVHNTSSGGGSGGGK